MYKSLFTVNEMLNKQGEAQNNSDSGREPCFLSDYEVSMINDRCQCLPEFARIFKLGKNKFNKMKENDLSTNAPFKLSS